MATVTFDHVTRSYGDFAAVNDLSLEIADGEFMVLVGPSGCGKTTSLRMIAGLEEVTEGTLRIGDRVVNDVAPKDRDIAMVFQSYALYPHMSVRDNMAFGLKLRKVPKAEIARLHQRLRTTTVYVTHDQVEAMTMGTRIAIMNHGVLQQVGTPQQVYDNPTNLFVAGFIGSPAMNLVRMTASADGLDGGGL
ncbi:MAG TPA: ABC transporter ATP-binding protein, partial [Candidatus Limnocylindrales bacterium]|nr:ABC transporter ATP-binding protein [Candidatus Limnocylindrales bacterium]